MALKNWKVTVVPPTKPFKKGTSKRRLYEWAVEAGTFTKAEFLSAAKELLEAGETESTMAPDIYAVAWWNEFYNKYGTFVDADEETRK